MDLYSWLLLVHVLSGAAWFGSGVTMVLLSRKANRDGSLFSFARQMEWIGSRIGPPVVVGLVGSGVWLVLRTEAIGFGELWVLTGLAVFAALVVIGAGFHNLQYKKINRAASEVGEDSTRVASLIRGSFRAAQIEVMLLLIVFFVMVFKPGS